MTIQIDYDRSERNYKWVDPESGEVFTFPSGKENKAAAWRFALSMLDSDLHDAAQRWADETPQIERLIWKGAELVATGGVDEKSATLHMVASSDSFGRYAVEQSDHGHTCQCISYTDHPQYDQHGNTFCKHIAAVVLHAVARAEY